MTPDQPLDQVESLLAETMAILDRHTVQLKQHTNLLINLTQIASQQSDNIEFLLKEVGDLKVQQTNMEARQTSMEARQTNMETELRELHTGQTSMDGKLDLILEKLSK